MIYHSKKTKPLLLAVFFCFIGTKVVIKRGKTNIEKTIKIKKVFFLKKIGNHNDYCT